MHALAWGGDAANEIADAQPDHAPSFYTLGYICFIADAFSTARHALEAALAIDADFTKADGTLERSRTAATEAWLTGGPDAGTRASRWRRSELLGVVDKELAAVAARDTATVSLAASRAVTMDADVRAATTASHATLAAFRDPSDEVDDPQTLEATAAVAGMEMDDPPGDQEDEEDEDDDEDENEDEDDDDDDHHHQPGTQNAREPDPAPLLEGSRPSAALRTALADVFKRFDRDGDGALSRTEVAALITAVNGQPPPPAAVQALLANFRSSSRGLLLDGARAQPACALGRPGRC